MTYDLQALGDRAAIGDVLLHYFRSCDRADAALMRSTFFADAEVDYGEFYRGDVDGFIAAAEGPEAFGGYDRTMHFVGNMLIELEGDVAFAETYVIAHHTTKPGHAWEGAFVPIDVRYLDRFERRDGRWAVARRRVVFEWVRRDTASAFEPLPAEAPEDHEAVRP
jgi:SnoaL-like domain